MRKHTDNCGKTGGCVVAACKLTCACWCHKMSTKASDKLKATMRTTHPAKQLAASGAKAITTFERACNRGDGTDVGAAWDLLYTLRSTFNEIEAQL